MDFKDKVVIVTGAGGGIGRAAAVLFAQAGAKVVVNCLTPANAAETLSLFPDEAEGIAVCGDVSVKEEAERIVAETVEEFGRVDILANVAGIVLGGTAQNTAEEDWDRTMDVNVKSVYLMSAAVIPHMKAQGGGVIVNTASSVAHKGVTNRLAYTASKGAVLSMTRAMAMDLLPDHIRVNSVSPGTTMSPSLERRLAASPDPEQALKDFVARQPMGRLGRPEEIAQAILLAASDEAAFMNGADTRVDGAMTC
ncbi:MAG: glucose 1-dehydrogenase [Lachnospiraceae bacterium]|nr:glucose 1-dehydrogenase [Lachnospiraceae bacterium]